MRRPGPAAGPSRYTGGRVAALEFVKLQGLGNDYVYVDGVRGPLPEGDLGRLAQDVSDRHFGVGGDGLIAVLPGERAPFRMRIWNADGSEGEMCGNGIRGLAKYVFESGYTSEPEFEVETLAGVKRVRVLVEDGRVGRVRVDMGEPRWGPPEETLEVEGETVRIQRVSMGNPHCILFVPDAERAPVRELGPRIERHPAFPNRTNVEFVAVEGPRRLAMRVWERGSGETLACGTGACAATVAAALTGRAERGVPVVVRLLGGELEIEWAGDGRVYMTGPTVEVFRGVYAPR
jgi:diaminopimelate epimerase